MDKPDEDERRFLPPNQGFASEDAGPGITTSIVDSHRRMVRVTAGEQIRCGQLLVRGADDRFYPCNSPRLEPGHRA